jgi:hypothetical protein
MDIRRWGAATVVAAMVMVAVSCTSKPPEEPLKIAAIDLSNAVDDKGRVVSLSETYPPTGTVYASISTEGSGTATLKARWLDQQGGVLKEESKTVTATGPTHTAFSHLPPGGWPAKGRYKVEFTIDGKDNRTREFEIR